MTADRTSPADSTPRRRISARPAWMLRAVKGAVAATCKAAGAVGHTLARRRREPGKPAVGTATRHAVAPRLLDATVSTPVARSPPRRSTAGGAPDAGRLSRTRRRFSSSPLPCRLRRFTPSKRGLCCRAQRCRRRWRTRRARSSARGRLSPVAPSRSRIRPSRWIAAATGPFASAWQSPTWASLRPT